MSGSLANLLDLEDFWENFGLPSASLDLAMNLERDFSVVEMDSAICDAQYGRSPGHDDFPTEISRKFSNLLLSLIMSVFEEPFVTQILPLSMHQAVVLLLPGKNEDPLDCSSCQPILLLNTGAGVLAGGSGGTT